MSSRTQLRRLETRALKAARMYEADPTDENQAALFKAVIEMNNYLPTSMTDTQLPYSNDSTSKQAAESMIMVIPPIRSEVMHAAFERYEELRIGTTCEKLEDLTCRPHTTVSSAVNWLAQNNWLVDTGARAKTKSGRWAIAWMPTPGAKQIWNSGQWRHMMRKAVPGK
jgi:hypothetical protein